VVVARTASAARRQSRYVCATDGDAVSVDPRGSSIAARHRMRGGYRGRLYDTGGRRRPSWTAFPFAPARRQAYRELMRTRPIVVGLVAAALTTIATASTQAPRTTRGAQRAAPIESRIPVGDGWLYVREIGKGPAVVV